MQAGANRLTICCAVTKGVHRLETSLLVQYPARFIMPLQPPQQPNLATFTVTHITSTAFSRCGAHLQDARSDWRFA